MGGSPAGHGQTVKPQSFFFASEVRCTKRRSPITKSHPRAAEFCRPLQIWNDLDAYYWDHIAKNMQNLRADLNGNARASNCCTFLGNPRQCLCHLACSTTTFATQVSTRVERQDLEGPAETEDHEDHGNLPTNVCQPSIWSLELTASWTAKQGFAFLGHDPLPAVLTMGISRNASQKLRVCIAPCRVRIAPYPGNVATPRCKTAASLSNRRNSSPNVRLWVSRWSCQWTRHFGFLCRATWFPPVFPSACGSLSSPAKDWAQMEDEERAWSWAFSGYRAAPNFEAVSLEAHVIPCGKSTNVAGGCRWILNLWSGPFRCTSQFRMFKVAETPRLKLLNRCTPQWREINTYSNGSVGYCMEAA